MSFRGFANHQRLSAILRCSCNAVSDGTLEKISHFGPIASSDESDQGWTTSWFILHSFAYNILCNTSRSIWHDRRRCWPLDLIHFLLHVPWRFCSTQWRLHIRLRKNITGPWWFSQPKLNHTRQWPLSYGAWSSIALLLGAKLGNIFKRIDPTSQYRFHFAIGFLVFQIKVITRSRFELLLRAFPWLGAWHLELLLRSCFLIRISSSLWRLLAARHRIALSGTSRGASIGLVFIISIEIRQVIKGPIFLHF